MWNWTRWLALLTAYGCVIYMLASPFAAGADSSGYIHEARLLRQGRLVLERRCPGELPVGHPHSPFLYAPLGFRAGLQPDKLVPTYPVGLPLHLMAASFLTGLGDETPLVMACSAVLCLVLVFFLAAELGLPVPWCYAAALILGLCPLYVRYATCPMSDQLASTWCTFAVLFALKASKRTVLALVAGFALGMAVLIRPTNAILTPTILIALGLDWRRLSLWALGGVPAALFQIAVNCTLYADPLALGYGDASSLFKLEYLTLVLPHYIQWLSIYLSPPIWLLFLAHAWLGPRGARDKWLLATWVWSFLGFYAFYRHTHETGWYLRFILPAFPALVVGALLSARGLTARFSFLTMRLGAALGVLLLGIYVGHCFYQGDFVPEGRYSKEQDYQLGCKWARQHLPADAIVGCMQQSGSLFYYTNFDMVRWDQFDSPDLFQSWNEKRYQLGRPLYAAVHDWEKQRALEEKMPGTWIRIGDVHNVSFWKRVDEDMERTGHSKSNAGDREPSGP